MKFWPLKTKYAYCVFTFKLLIGVSFFRLESCSGTVYTSVLDAGDVNVCQKPLYYNVETLYIIRAKNKVYGSNCEINFLDWNDAIVGQPCVSLCVRVHNNSMKSCDFKMTYYDGLGDLNEKSFDCHSFPPILWCSRKNEIKIKFKELKKYKGDGYDVTLEVTSYCSDDEDSADDKSDNTKAGNNYNEEKRKEEKRTRDTVIIAGSLVSTVSFILVICWVTYCCWKRRQPSESNNRPQTAGSATSSSTPKSEMSGHRPCQYSAFSPPVHTSHTPQQYNQHPVRQYLQQKQPNPYVNAYNYPVQTQTDRYIQLPETGMEMKDSFVQYKTQPTQCNRDVTFRDDHLLGVNYSEAGHSYDADDDSPEKELTPPIPPRPSLVNSHAKQYFI